MKILFICVSLELGKDGIGDYSRNLAGELVRMGHSVYMIALNDKFIFDVERGSQTINDTSLETMRLSEQLPWAKRYKLVKTIIDSFQPGWISLHYVPFGYQNKGLPFTFNRIINRLTNNIKIQIMFHELWVGLPQRPSFSQRLYQFLQKKLIANMVSSLRPAVIHTHLPEYYAKLQKECGGEPKALPLFSNIAIYPAPPPSEYKHFTIGFFSQFEMSQAIINFIKSIYTLLSQSKIIRLLFIGGSAAKAESAINAIRQYIGSDCVFEVTGHVASVEETSHYLQKCQVAVTPIPRHALGKSSSLASFLGHGVPIAAPNISKGYAPDNIGFFWKELKGATITEFSTDSYVHSQHMATLAVPKMTVQKIAESFLHDLQNAER